MFPSTGATALKKTALILCGLMLSPATALAGQTCSPSHDDARILSGPSEETAHRDWPEGRQLAYGWSLRVERSEQGEDGGEYHVGDLYDADGKLVTRDVFVHEHEWDCGP
jgi:hypothetical protein